MRAFDFNSCGYLCIILLLTSFFYTRQTPSLMLNRALECSRGISSFLLSILGIFLSLSPQRLHLTPSPHPPRLVTHLSLLLLLPLPLLINLRGERIFKPQRNLIHHQNQHTQHQPGRFPKPQRRPHKTHRTPIVHRAPTDIEGKPCDNLIHQNSKIISQICPRDPQSPHTRQHENIAARYEAHGERLR